MKNRRGFALAVSVIGILSAVANSSAQTPGQPGQTASQNSRGGAVRTRNPGNLVNNGVGRHADFSDRQAMGTVITELPTEPPFPGLIADALQVVFDQINTAITAFRNLLLIRAGQTPALSSPAAGAGSASGGGRR